MTNEDLTPLPEESFRKAHREGTLIQVAKAEDADGFIDVYATCAVDDRFGRSGVLYLLGAALRRLVRKDPDGPDRIGKGVYVLNGVIKVVSYGSCILVAFAEEPIPE